MSFIGKNLALAPRLSPFNKATPRGISPRCPAEFSNP